MSEQTAPDPGDTGAHGRATDEVLGDQVAQCFADLRALVEDARPVPMSTSVRIHGTDLRALLGDLEQAVRQRVAQAHEVEQHRDSLLSEAQRQADDAVRAASIQRESLVSDSEVYKVARREADQLLAAAEEDAETLLGQTDAYVVDRLATLESGLRETLEVVRRGQERLAQAPDAPRLHRVLDGPPPSEYAVPPPLPEPSDTVLETTPETTPDDEPQMASDLGPVPSIMPVVEDEPTDLDPRAPGGSSHAPPSSSAL